MNHQETEARSIKVIGCLHPDTDSICSAIAYSRLRGKLNPACIYQAYRAGELNRETKFVLYYFRVETPELFTDASPRIEDADCRRTAGVDGKISPRQAWALMMIVQAAPVRRCMVTGNQLTFTPQTLVENASQIMVSVRYRYFPILDGAGRYLGMVSRRNLLNLKKRQMILVDHNERSQAVDGLDEAEVLEIIDHHRLNPTETDGLVYFRNEPVGCNSTIIWNLYRENGVEIEPDTAGLMLSAILSDTLMFRSSTCTSTDEKAARALAELAGVEVEPYAEEMFEAGVTSPARRRRGCSAPTTRSSARGRSTSAWPKSAPSPGRTAWRGRPWWRHACPASGRSRGWTTCSACSPTRPTPTPSCWRRGRAPKSWSGRPSASVRRTERRVLKGIVSRKKQLVPALLDAIKQRSRPA